MSGGKAAGGVLASVVVVPVLVVLAVSGAAPPPPDPVGAGGGGAALNSGKIPAKYVTLVQQAGTVCPGITAPSIAAQIMAESQWNPTAGSPAGAQGIAQFMPGTWPGWGKDSNGNGINSPLDPGDAIPAQARFMCALYAQITTALKAGRVSGDPLELAWAGYNAGFGAVTGSGGIPQNGETPAYVATIKKWMAVYSQPAATAPDPAGGAGFLGAGGGTWVNPMTPGSYRLSSGFGPRRSPGGVGSTNHQGQDLAAPTGTPIRAACTGTVIFVQYPMGGMGKGTAIDCGAGVRTLYGHQSAQQVTVGQKVAAGQQIGLVGSTGNSTGAHLHFTVNINVPLTGRAFAGQPVNPVPFMRQHGAPL